MWWGRWDFNLGQMEMSPENRIPCSVIAFLNKLIISNHLKTQIEDCSIVVYRLIYDLLTLSCLLAFLKQQIMIDIHTIFSRLIGMEPPTFLLHFLDYFSNIFMMTNLNTFILFQLNYHPFSYSVIPVFSVRYMFSI